MLTCSCAWVVLSRTVGLKMASILVNSYMMNLYGILEGMISNTPLCEGFGLNHYALDNCNSQPLSMRPVYEQLIKVHRQLDQVLAKTVAYVAVVFGLEQTTQQLAYSSLLAFALGPLAKSSAFLNTLKIGGDAEYMQKIAASFESIGEKGVAGVGAFVGGSVQAVFASMHGMFYLYDELFLKYVVVLIRNKDFKGKYDMDAAFFAFSNRIFDSIAVGAMKNTLVAPQYRVCQTYSQLTTDTQSALGKTVFHSCVAVIEVFYAGMQIVSSTITLSAVSDCICNINQNEREFIDQYEERCRYKMPETLHPRLVEYMIVRDRRQSVSVCATLVNNFKNVLLKIPTEAKMHINLALTHAVDVPVEMMNFMKIDGLQADSCTQYTTNLDVMTIIPRPISAFKKCAYVPSCRSKCQQEIDVFYAKKLSVASPSVQPINSALMAFVPAWASEIENLEEQFVPIAVQDYGHREACDHYIVVIGRPVNHERVLNAPWTMYIFCYLHETTSLAIMSKIVLPATRHFVLSRSELIDKQKKDTGSSHFKLVSELILPPLDDVNDRGALVVVLWDDAATGADDDDSSSTSTSNHNAIFEIFVDSLDTVHAAWLLRSKQINNDRVCANLHASVMASCGGRIADISMYNFVNTGLDSATFKKIAILPKKQPAQTPQESDTRTVVYTIIGLLQVFVEYSMPGDDGPTTMCTVDLEFTWPQYRSARGQDSRLALDADVATCHVNHPIDTAVNVNNMTVFSLLNNRVLRQKEVLLSTTELGTLVLISSSQLKLQTLKAVMDDSSGTQRLMFTVVHTDDITLDSLFLTNNKQRHTTYSRFDYNTIGAFVGTQLHDAAHSKNPKPTPGNRIVYTVKECSMSMTSQIQGFIREYVISLSSATDMTVFKYRGDSADGSGAASDPDSSPLRFEMGAGTGIATTMEVEVAEVCDYMNCKACRTRQLKSLCEGAQRCAIVNCVGTVLNPNNVLCVAGSLVKEVLEVYLSNVDAMWFGLVEIAMSIMKLAKVSGSKDVIMLESVSNVMNVALCETKDIYAALSAVVPSFVFSVYVAVAGKKEQNSILNIENPGESKVRQLFSPGTQLRNVAIVSSVTQTIYQFALILLHIGDASSKLMLCTLDKFAEFSGGYIDVIDHDVELGKESTIDYCMSRLGAPDGLRAFSDEEIVNNRVAIGAVDNNIVKVKIAGRRIRAGVFTVDTTKAIVWAKNYNYITWLIWVNAAFDSMLGILYGFSRIAGVVESDECRARPVEFSSVLKCVCSDVAYVIHSTHRRQVASNGALWCSGMLKMVNAEGNIVYVDNPFSLEQLSTDLHRPAQVYIDCIAIKSEGACADARANVFLAKYATYFDKHKVSPLAVLGQCRENYNSKTWDEGVFGLYNADLQFEILRTGMSSLSRMQELRNQVDTYLNEAANGIIGICLAAGPLKNRIGACMQLTFTHHNQQQQQRYTQQSSDALLLRDFSTAGYFVYDVAMPLDNPDACEYLSSPSFLKNTDVRKCRSEDTVMDSPDANACGMTMLERDDTCRIGTSTLAYEQSIQTNIIDEFRVSNEAVYDAAKIAQMDQTVHNKHSAIAACTSDYARSVEQEIMPNIRDIVDALDLSLVTSEGDLIHQFVDCIMMGANKKTIMAPADTAGLLENFMYSRHVNGTSREFELPCAGSYVSSQENGQDSETFRQKTCGTDTRISVMAYVTREILHKDNDGIHALVAQLITEKVASITSAFANVQDYGCLDQATGLIWYRAGTEAPAFGRELNSTALRNALATADTRVVTLTTLQWLNTAITDLRKDDFVKSGNIFFRQSLGTSWKYCCAIPGQCTPGESSFESNLPELDTTISIASIMTALTETMKSIEIDTITTRKVLPHPIPTRRICPASTTGEKCE